ncbi:aminotransferase class I/II-fold pyridoxal phosphate-dependent enzyme [Candidatus Poribacteria bacterium]|nr:aminotransferase class I/II-fold pyridoxal phosphate-dependent enzyme [Candidatus Poribacteria bacterium]
MSATKPFASGTSRMPISGIRMVMDLAAKIPDAIHLEVGQPDFRTPPHIVEAAHRAALDGYTAYTPNAGFPSLRAACAEKVRRENLIDADASNIVVTVGSEGAVASTFVALVDHEDEVLVPEPGWTNYAMLTHARGATPIAYALHEEDGFVPRIDEIARRITHRTKLLVINSPGNPSGAVIPGDVMRELVALADDAGLYILSDEAYEKLVFDGEHVSPGRFDTAGRVVSAFSFSKSYAMTGWRVGFAVAAEPIAKLMTLLQEPYYSCAPSVSQKAAEAALAGPQDCVEQMVAAYARRQRTVVEAFGGTNLVGYQPAGAFYVLVSTSHMGMASFDLVRDCLEKTHVAVAPGATFGPRAEGYIRISVATRDEDVAKGAARLRDYLAGSSGR